ncbi:MAG: hypothetical protein KDH89_04110 [Anaerolineae bacterium]|nr:hypothetical protein [Anaerolineae bacterium]
MRKVALFLLIGLLMLAACGGGSDESGGAQSQGDTGDTSSGSSAATSDLLAIDPDSIAMVTTLAGSGEQGSDDGVGAAATFTQPVDVRIGPDGNIYAISFRGRRIVRITPEGEVTTLAFSEGTGDKDGPAGEAQFGNSRSLAVAEDGTIYFADWENKKLKKLTPDGVISTFAESGFLEQTIMDADGSILATGGSNREYVMRITPDGEISAAIGNKGVAGVTDGDVKAAKFSNLSGIAMDAAGNTYLTQGISLRQKAGDQVIRMVDPAGNASSIAGQRFQEGYEDGSGPDAKFKFPVALAAAPDGTLFVADSLNNCIRRISPGPDFEVTTVAGACGEDGSLMDGDGQTARFKNPQGIVLTEDGTLFVADSLNNAIRKITFQ